VTARRFDSCSRVVCGVAFLVVGQAACAPRPSVEEGRALFKANGCANCHGTEGHGDGRLALTLVRRPRDLRDLAAFKSGTNESAIASTIALGLGPGASQMPQFSHLTEEERRSIALFVISLRGGPETNRATGER
jgi:cytochrome c553